MSALTIESPRGGRTVSSRRGSVRPAARPARPDTDAAPRFSAVRRAGDGRVAHGCRVQVPPLPAALTPVAVSAGEWRLTDRGLAVAGSALSLAFVVGLVTLVMQFLAIPAN